MHLHPRRGGGPAGLGHGLPRESGAWILPDTAKKLGWPVQIPAFNLTSPTGTISPEVESAVADRLDDGAIFQVERGYQSPPG